MRLWLLKPNHRCIMNGFSSTEITPTLDDHGGVQDVEAFDCEDLSVIDSDVPPPCAPDYASRWAAGVAADGDQLPDVKADEDNEALLRSFDMIFELHQRSEEIRRSLDRIDKLLLTSRTVVGLVETLTETLRSDMDLIAARILFMDDHAVARAFEGQEAGHVISRSFSENESLFHGEPYILNDPSGDLGELLFGDEAHLVASAAVANLCTGTEEMGLLCLGSEDPHRYCGGMNTELIAALADKIALGLRNAWDHETRVRKALMAEVDGVYSEAFLKEYLTKEFHRSWRTYRTFSLIAVAWGFSYAMESPATPELVSLIKSNLRSADVLAEGETVNLWVLLPDTNLEGARTAAARVVQCVGEHSGSSAQLYAGVTAFSRDAVTMHKLMHQAKIALAQAMEADNDRVIAMPIAL